MNAPLSSGIIAVLAGAFVGVLLFVPFVALSYRRRGRLSAARLLLWAGALVYFWAIWTYTLLPLPDGAVLRCAGVNLDPTTLLDDVRGAAARPGPFVTDRAVLQLLLNVLLFAPLGFFLRVLAGRGVVVAVAVGLGVSAFVEATQFTGVWGVYDCAYRVTDVVDLMTNTAGALLGSILAFAVPAHRRGAERAPDADAPRPVTRRRRALGMLCDALGMLLVAGVASIAVQLWLFLVEGERAALSDDPRAVTAGIVVGTGLWLLVIVVTGRSIGDHAIRVRFTRGVLPEWLARPARWVGGVSGYVLLDALPAPWDALALVFAGASVVLLLVFRDGRGLPGLLGGRRVADARAPQHPLAPTATVAPGVENM